MSDVIQLTTAVLRQEYGVLAEQEVGRRIASAKARQDQAAVDTWNAVLSALAQSATRKATAGVWP